jgi:hypothetical protein
MVMSDEMLSFRFMTSFICLIANQDRNDNEVVES